MNSTSIHHIVPTSRGGERHPGLNTIKLPMHFHQALHVLYGNASPLQQVLMVMDHDKGFRGNKALEMYDLIEYYKFGNHDDSYVPDVIIQPNLLWTRVKSNSGKVQNILDAHRCVHYSEYAHTEVKIQTLLALADTVLTNQFKKRANDILA